MEPLGGIAMGKKVLDRALVFGTGASFYSLLETLWRMAVEGHTQNETAALLRAADEWLSSME